MFHFHAGAQLILFHLETAANIYGAMPTMRPGAKRLPSWEPREPSDSPYGRQDRDVSTPQNTLGSLNPHGGLAFIILLLIRRNEARDL
jgi:hypothetical protein